MERELKNVPPASASRLREDIRVARDEITRLDRIVSQFLRAIRPTKPDLQRASINEIVTETLTLLERELKNRDILVELELAADLPRCLVDRAQLKQAFYNLIKNALQASRAGGILRIRTEASETHIVVSFVDTGYGISPEQIGRIFEPYYTTKPEGSGLGLMIVQRIVREHGGTIDVESDMTRGTTVRLKLLIHERRTRLLEAGKETDVERQRREP
jgi:signal transduction histidine kinase